MFFRTWLHTARPVFASSPSPAELCKSGRIESLNTGGFNRSSYQLRPQALETQSWGAATACVWQRGYTSRVSPAPLIRPVRPDDEAIVGQIAYQTAFFGQSARTFFPHEALFSLLWTHPYFLEARPTGFVAEVDGQVVGYIIGAANQRKYQRQVVSSLILGLWRNLRPLNLLPATLPYLWRIARYPTPHADWRAYPAHLHINLLPQARGLRLGEQLLQAYLLDLSERGVPGMQLSTTTENRAALGLYRKAGFQELLTRVTPLWTPWLGHPARHVIMGRKLTRLAAAPQAEEPG